MAAIGNDFGQYRKWLIKNRIEVKYLKVIKDEGSSIGFVMNDQRDNQIWGYCYGALRHGKSLSLKKIKEPIDLFIISATHLETFNGLTSQAISLKIPYLYDFGMLLTAIKKNDLKRGILNAVIIVGNDYEIALMLEKTGLTKKQILSKDKILITTLAEKGSIIETSKKIIKIKPARPKKVLDPTGAGDAYRAGFLTGYQKGFDLKVCGKMGAVSAVYAVEKYGTQEHFFTKKEFSERFKENFGKDLCLGLE